MSPDVTTADPTAPAPPRDGSFASSEAKPLPRGQAAIEEIPIALFSDEQLVELRSRWDQIQAGFVDEPRGAVEAADALVADAISRLSEGFARTRGDLDGQWKRGDQVSTEDLRVALRHYRSFFTRLLQA